MTSPPKPPPPLTPPPARREHGSDLGMNTSVPDTTAKHLMLRSSCIERPRKRGTSHG